MIKNFFKKKYTNLKKGFTLVELMVVVFIISIISLLTLFNSSRLDSAVLLSNTAYEINLIIRDAQVSGLGSKLFSTNGVATTTNQGVYFDYLKPQEIILFSDLNKNNKYDDISENIQVYKIENKRAGKIMNLCKLTIDNTCNESVTKLNIIFKRPNPEAYFYTGMDESSITEYQGSVGLTIGFDSNQCRSLVIYKTGAIQIDKSLCI